MNSVGISTGPDTHLDHLGVLCSLLGIPLIVTDPDVFSLAREHYPFCDTLLMEPRDLSLEFLSTFDAIFECGKFWAMELVPLIQLLHRKTLRVVFCPHGNSDKGSFLSAPQQDIALYYGDHMRTLLEGNGAWAKISHPVRTGNYRIEFYRKHQSFYDDLLQQRILLDPSKKTILYAPTWDDGENPSSFFSACSNIIDQLTPFYNLIVKLHPLLAEFHFGETLQILSRYESCSSVIFLDKFPPIYPLLNRTDLYLGDYSSIGYDFLAFDKPLLFLGNAKKTLPLHACGVSVKTEDCLSAAVQNALETRQEHLSNLRKQTYDCAFGEQVNTEQLKLTIKQVLKKNGQN